MAPLKIHLKRTETDHLTVCGIFAEANWVLIEAAVQLDEGAICKLCKGMAGDVAVKVATHK
jgi:hypothetical protein